jgi:hypothetical protein
VISEISILRGLAVDGSERHGTEKARRRGLARAALREMRQRAVLARS